MGHTSGHASGRVRQQGDSTALATRRVLPGAYHSSTHTYRFLMYAMYMQIMFILPMVCTCK